MSQAPVLSPVPGDMGLAIVLVLCMGAPQDVPSALGDAAARSCWVECTWAGIPYSDGFLC